MTYGEMIDKIMPLVKNGSTLPLIISRNDGKWELDYLNLSPDKTAEYLKSVREKDPYAVKLTGEDFARGSYAYVYDRVLTARLRAEYDAAAFDEANIDELHALVNFLEDNISELSSDVSEYIVRFDRPLAVLNDMLPISLKSEDSDCCYDGDKAGEAIEIIEQKITGLINRPSDERDDKTEKRNIEGYEERASIQLAGRVIVLAENPDANNPYLVCNLKYDNPLGMEERYDGVVTDNYLEALREYISRETALLESLEAEHQNPDLPFHTLTAADCMPNSADVDLEGKVIIIKPEVLSPEYKCAEHQYALCTGGFGSKPNARGNAVFIKKLFDGKESRIERRDDAGLADHSKMPTWAVEKLSAFTKPQESQISTPPVKQKPPKKPSLHDKLEKAKKAVREADRNNVSRGNQSKKKGDMELD